MSISINKENEIEIMQYQRSGSVFKKISINSNEDENSSKNIEEDKNTGDNFYQNYKEEQIK